MTLIATERDADDPILYQNDFEGSIGSEWSTNQTSVTPKASRRFLGDYEIVFDAVCKRK